MPRVAVSPSHNRDWDRGAEGPPRPRAWALELSEALLPALWDEGVEAFPLKVGDVNAPYGRRREAAKRMGADLLLSVRPVWAQDGDEGSSAVVLPGTDAGAAEAAVAAGAGALGVPARAVQEEDISELDPALRGFQLRPANLALPRDRHAATRPGAAGDWARAVAGSVADHLFEAAPPPDEESGEWEVWIDGEPSGEIPGLLSGEDLWVPAGDLLSLGDLSLAGLEREGRRLLLSWRSIPWWSVSGSGEEGGGEVEVAVFADADGRLQDGVFTLRGEEGSLTLEVDEGRVRRLRLAATATSGGGHLDLDLSADLETSLIGGRALLVRGPVAVSVGLTEGEREARVSWRGGRGRVEAAWSPTVWEVRATVRVG